MAGLLWQTRCKWSFQSVGSKWTTIHQTMQRPCRKLSLQEPSAREVRTCVIRFVSAQFGRLLGNIPDFRRNIAFWGKSLSDWRAMNYSFLHTQVLLEAFQKEWKSWCDWTSQQYSMSSYAKCGKTFRWSRLTLKDDPPGRMIRMRVHVYSGFSIECLQSWLIWEWPYKLSQVWNGFRGEFFILQIKKINLRDTDCQKHPQSIQRGKKIDSLRERNLRVLWIHLCSCQCSMISDIGGKSIMKIQLFLSEGPIVPVCEYLYVRRKYEFFLSGHVDSMKMTGKQRINRSW